MAPMDINDWWLAAAAAAAAGFVAPTATAATNLGGQVGIVTSVRSGVVSATNERVVYIGNTVVFGERFRTDGTGIIHILFMDQSSMTLGPNSELVIDEFVFQPKERSGNIAVNLIKGSLRVVGGFISKLTSPKGPNSALVRTATATIGIRGGISIVETEPGQTQGTFLFGEHMDFLTPDEQSGPRVTRPGFSVIANNGRIGSPFRRLPSEMSNLIAGFESRQGSRSTGTGSLISTNDRPGGLSSPGTSLSPNRTQQVSQEVNTQTPGRSLRSVMGIDSTQIQS